MSFMENFTIYESPNKKVKVYIEEVHNGRRITKLFAIRRKDYGELIYLGAIKFDPGWRQYITEFEPNTKWSSGCKKKICEFEDIITTKWREGIRRKNVQTKKI